MEKIVALLLTLLPFLSLSQNYQKANEQIQLEFLTSNGKRLLIAMDTTDMYLVVRFGTNDSIEFQLPAELDSSWTDFTYSWYLRGGGTENEGLDLNYLYFENGGSRYVVFQEYYSQTQETNHGLKIINLESKKQKEFNALSNTVSGSLYFLRDAQKVRQGDELFD